MAAKDKAIYDPMDDPDLRAPDPKDVQLDQSLPPKQHKPTPLVAEVEPEPAPTFDEVAAGEAIPYANAEMLIAGTLGGSGDNHASAKHILGRFAEANWLITKGDENTPAGKAIKSRKEADAKARKEDGDRTARKLGARQPRRATMPHSDTKGDLPTDPIFKPPGYIDPPKPGIGDNLKPGIDNTTAGQSVRAPDQSLPEHPTKPGKPAPLPGGGVRPDNALPEVPEEAPKYDEVASGEVIPAENAQTLIAGTLGGSGDNHASAKRILERFEEAEWEIRKALDAGTGDTATRRAKKEAKSAMTMPRRCGQEGQGQGRGGCQAQGLRCRNCLRPSIGARHVLMPAFEGGDVPEDDVLVGVIPTERHVVDIVDPKDVSALIADKLGGGKRQYGIADAVLALFAEKRWHVIREG